MNAYECVDARSSHAPLTGGGLADNSRIVGHPEVIRISKIQPLE